MKFVKVRNRFGREVLLNLALVESIGAHESGEYVQVFSVGDPDTAYEIGESFETMEELVGLRKTKKPITP